MNARINKLEKQVSLIEDELRMLYSSEDKNKDQREPKDKLWLCEKCNSRIGILDDDTGDVRIRYKDFVAYWKPSTGSDLTVICRSCSYPNKRSG